MVAQLRAELAATTDFNHQLVLQQDDLISRVNELVQEQNQAQHYLRYFRIERNAAIRDLPAEQALREVLTT